MLHYETVTDTLLEVLKRWQNYEELSDFRLVGGTALSLYFGHRISDDIDLFTPKDIPDTLEILLFENENLKLLNKGKYHIAVFDHEVKVDFTHWNMDFEDFDAIDGIKMASPMDIFGMKFDAITSRKTRKDFYDLFTLTNHFGFAKGFERYNKLMPYSKNSQIILEAIGDIDEAESTLNPILFHNQNWDEVKEFLKKEAKKYFLG